MASSSMQPEPQPSAKPNVAGRAGAAMRGRLGAEPSMDANLDFDTGGTVTIDITSTLPSTATSVVVFWDGGQVYSTSDPNDPGLHDIPASYVSGSTNNSLQVRVACPSVNDGGTYSKGSIGTTSGRIVLNRQT